MLILNTCPSTDRTDIGTTIVSNSTASVKNIKEFIDLYIIIGESTAEGFAPISTLPSQYYTQSQVLWTGDGGGSGTFGVGEFVPLDVEQVNNYGISQRFGLDVVLGYNYVQKYNKPVLLLKTALGGATVCDKSSQSDWHLSNQELISDFENIYTNAVDSLCDTKYVIRSTKILFLIGVNDGNSFGISPSCHLSFKQNLLDTCNQISTFIPHYQMRFFTVGSTINNYLSINNDLIEVSNTKDNWGIIDGTGYSLFDSAHQDFQGYLDMSLDILENF